MYWKRWLTALVLLPPLIFLIFKGGQLLFAIVVIATALLCLREYFRIAFTNHTPRIPGVYHGWGYLSGVVIMVCAYRQSYLAMILSLTLSVIGAAAISIHRFSVSQDAPLVAVKQVFGVFYIGICLSFIILLRSTPNGPLWVFFLFWVIAWGDTGALYVGSTLGRHKLCPAVSPKKTIEGALGGLTANLIFAWIFKILFLNTMSGMVCTTFALTVGAVGQLGDLFESEFKRVSGVKDSSTLLPGHGGFWDRLDAMLLAAPVAYALKEYLLP